jgi:hypothetical protein
VKITAYGLGTLSRESDEAEAVISIGRKKHAPVFTEDDYEVDIDEELTVGCGVIAVRADDPDQV